MYSMIHEYCIWCLNPHSRGQYHMYHPLTTACCPNTWLCRMHRPVLCRTGASFRCLSMSRDNEIQQSPRNLWFKQWTNMYNIYIDHIYIFSYGIKSKHQHVLPQLFIGPFDFKIHPKKNLDKQLQNQTKTNTQTHKIISWCWNPPSPAPCSHPDCIFC